MEKKFEHPILGTALERVFVGVNVDRALDEALSKARKRKLLADFEHDGESLTVKRRWVEGKDAREVFRDLSPDDRDRNSVELFRFLGEEGRQVDHGAIHPGNVIFGSGGFELVDAVANHARLGLVPSAEAALTYPIWLWGSTIPKGMKPAIWDELNLLRMVAFLASDPETWEEARAAGEVMDLCRDWVAKAVRFLDPDDPLRRAITRAEAELDQLPVEAASEEPASSEDLAKAPTDAVEAVPPPAEQPRADSAASPPPEASPDQRPAPRPEPTMAESEPQAEQPQPPVDETPVADQPSVAESEADASVEPETPPVEPPEPAVAPTETPPAVVRDHDMTIIDELLVAVQQEGKGDRMLRSQSEGQVRQRALERGIGEASCNELLPFRLCKLRFRTEDELTEQARWFLENGVRGPNRFRTSAYHNAIRAFTHWHVDPVEAERRVRELLRNLKPMTEGKKGIDGARR